jgi:hypothetical protein
MILSERRYLTENFIWHFMINISFWLKYGGNSTLSWSWVKCGSETIVPLLLCITFREVDFFYCMLEKLVLNTAGPRLSKFFDKMYSTQILECRLSFFVAVSRLWAGLHARGFKCCATYGRIKSPWTLIAKYTFNFGFWNYLNWTGF